MKRNIWICAGIKSNGNKSISKRRFNYNIEEAKRREKEGAEGAQSNRDGRKESKRARASMSFCVKIKPSNNKNHVQ